MKLVLTGLQRLEFIPAEKSAATGEDGDVMLQVTHCAVCRTDAKMWRDGHRDLIFPRVLGHELVAADDNGQRFVVWPGRACGRCHYCRSGRENLCENMRIMGFHIDGGFCDSVAAPRENLIPVPADLPAAAACFAEPTGCVFNAMDMLDLADGEKLIIYGGGTLGLIAAMVCLEKGVRPLVIEKNARKAARAARFLEQSGIACVPDTHMADFDAALTACPDPAAFCRAVAKVRKGGRLAFFSGLDKNGHIETNLLNLVHYREVRICGAYGLTRSDMHAALGVIARKAPLFEHLVERIVAPDAAADLMPAVLSGDFFKFIIRFDAPPEAAVGARPGPARTQGGKTPPQSVDASPAGDGPDAVIESIRPLSKDLQPAAQEKIDNKTKPLGALGKLEDLALQMCLIQNSLAPQVAEKALFVFAADHGVAEEGVSAYPAEVTGEMVKNFLAGGAAINVLCRHHGIDIRVVDMGVNADFEPHPRLVDKKIRRGTRNFALQPAMTAQEARRALGAGMDVFFDRQRTRRIAILGLGDMGIANTTSSSAIISAVTGISALQATGRGTGIDDQGLAHKAEIIQKALDFHRPDPKDGFDVLQKVGGFEIAGIAGAALAAASQQVAVVLDGVISTAAGLIAYLINPDIKGYLIAGHRSVEAAQAAALAHMGLEPVIDFGMRLGEGTGAALTMGVVDAACRIMREMASFESAGVSQNL